MRNCPLFDAYIYLSTETKFTLQVVLRNIISTAKLFKETAVHRAINPSENRS